MTGKLFTPRTKSWQRLRWTISAADKAKTGRGRWRATITNLDDGQTYIVRGASCGLPRCMCDAVVVRQVQP